MKADEDIWNEVDLTVFEPAIFPQVTLAESQLPTPSPGSSVLPGGASQTRGLHPLDPKTPTGLSFWPVTFLSTFCEVFRATERINLGFLVQGSGKNG